MKTIIYFITSNDNKRKEIESYFKENLDDDSNYEVKYYETDKLQEIQTTNIDDIVRDKALKAYGKVMRPVFVDHSGIQITDLGNIPGGITEPFWKSIEREKFSDLFIDHPAKAITKIGFCDGKCIFIFSGEIDGEIIMPKMGDYFDWDSIFRMKGTGKTLSEQKDEKSQDMRTIAMDMLKKKLEELYN